MLGGGEDAILDARADSGPGELVNNAKVLRDERGGELERSEAFLTCELAGEEESADEH